MRLLSIDIETQPHLAHVWGLYNQNVGLNQLLEPTEMLCFAAKWYGERKVYFHAKPDGHTEMVAAAWELLNEADVVMHYNGRRFDVPHLNREFVQLGLNPPSPFQQIDLLAVVRKRFRFASNKLAYVSKALGLSGKVEHEGHQLWIKCMAGDKAAWQRMRKYNRQDVVLLEELYELLLPWIPNHPSYATETGERVCTRCGKPRLVKDGFTRLKTGTYQQYRCAGCGGWCRDTRRVSGAPVVEVAA